MHNITDKKVVELAILESDKRLKKAEQMANLGHWEQNIQDGKLIWSDQVFRIFGEEPQSFKPTFKRLLSFVEPEDQDLLEINYWKSVEEKTLYECQYRIRRTDGICRYVQERATHEYDENGTLMRTTGMIMDVTQRVLMFQKLQEANMAKDKFFSLIAHDLKSPFNNLQGLLDVLALTENDQASQVEVMGHIKKVVKHGKQLLENLLEWARAQTGKIEFSPKQLVMEELVDSCFNFFSASASAKSITLKKKFEEDGLSVIADRNMIDTVLRNLVANAIKFTLQGGEITVGHREIDDDYEMFYVEDSGIGISNENLVKLFSIDQNFTTLGTANEKGTGIGLLLCKEFIEKNKGVIWAESEVGQGSTFYFTLKRERPFVQPNQNEGGQPLTEQV